MSISKTTHPGVIPGRSAAKGKGIHLLPALRWIPFPALQAAGDDTGGCASHRRKTMDAP